MIDFLSSVLASVGKVISVPILAVGTFFSPAPEITEPIIQEPIVEEVVLEAPDEETDSEITEPVADTQEIVEPEPTPLPISTPSPQLPPEPEPELTWEEKKAAALAEADALEAEQLAEKVEPEEPTECENARLAYDEAIATELAWNTETQRLVDEINNAPGQSSVFANAQSNRVWEERGAEAERLNDESKLATEHMWEVCN